VLIAALPRSGSSLVAKIFMAHGLWVGRVGEKGHNWTKSPYCDYENRDIDQWYRDRRQPLPKLIEKITPKGQRLLYKCSPWKARIFLREMPDSTVIKTCRTMKSIIKSGATVNNPDAALRMKQKTELDDIGGTTVDVDALIDRDFTTIKSAIERCGLVFDAELTESQIDDSLWHHRA